LPTIRLVVKHAAPSTGTTAKLVQRMADGAEPETTVKGATAGGDRQRLRGLPALHKGGVGGAIVGTLPHVAILRLDDERRR
jgi:hypothetical protein